MAGAAFGGMAGGLTSGFIEGYTKRKEYQKQKDFIVMRHRWAVRDMKKAGLNPILAAGGNPPIGSMPDIGGAGEAVGEGISDAVDKYYSAKSIKAAIKKTEADTRLAEAAIQTERGRQELLHTETQAKNIANQMSDFQNRLDQKYGDTDRVLAQRNIASSTRKNVFDSSGVTFGGLRFNAAKEIKDTVSKFISEGAAKAKDYLND